MTVTRSAAPLPDVDVTRLPLRPARSQLEVARQQVAGIESFNRVRREQEEVQTAAGRSREMRMDSARRLEVLRCEHEALITRAQEQLQASGDVLRPSRSGTVLLAHRSTWFLDRIDAALAVRGVTVVARVDNGAQAVGLAVAEQPDLVLVEDTLAMVPGEEVVREVLRYCPSTRVVAQVAYGDRVEHLRQAGAVEVFTRRVPPAEVAAALHRLVAVPR